MRARFSFSACSFTATYPPRRMEGEREGGHGSILLPARDETKGKLTSAQWFSLLSRNCFSKFVSYRWKRTEVELSSFFSFFLFFSTKERRRGKEKEKEAQIRFFQTEFHLSWITTKEFQFGGLSHREIRTSSNVEEQHFLFGFRVKRNNIPSPTHPRLYVRTLHVIIIRFN